MSFKASDHSDAPPDGRPSWRTEKIAYAERRARYCHDVSQRKAPAGRGATLSMRRMKPPQSGQRMKASQTASASGSPHSAFSGSAFSCGLDATWSRSRTRASFSPRSAWAKKSKCRMRWKPSGKDGDEKAANELVRGEPHDAALAAA